MHNKLNLRTHGCSEGKCTFIPGHQARRGVVEGLIDLWTLRNGIFSAVISKQGCQSHQQLQAATVSPKGIQEGAEDLLYSSHQTRASPYDGL